MPRETLKPDPQRLKVLERKFQSLHSQSRGVWERLQAAERQRAIVDARLRLGRRRAEEWKRWQAAPTGIHFMSEAQAWAERLNATGTEGLADDEAELAELDETISNLQRSYDELMAAERPLGELVTACQRHMNRPHRVVQAVVANARDDGASGFAEAPPAADPGAGRAPSGQSAAGSLSPANAAFATAIEAMRGGAARLLGGRGQ